MKVKGDYRVYQISVLRRRTLFLAVNMSIQALTPLLQGPVGQALGCLLSGLTSPLFWHGMSAMLPKSQTIQIFKKKS